MRPGVCRAALALRCFCATVSSLATIGCGILEPGPTVVIEGYVTVGGEPQANLPVRAVLSLGGCGFSGCSREEGIQGGHATTSATGFYRIEGEHDAGCGHELTVVTTVLETRVGRSVGGCGEHVVNFSCPPGAPLVSGSIYDQCL